MRYFLQDPTYKLTSNIPKETISFRSLAHWTREYFILDDNQVYRKLKNIRGTNINECYIAYKYNIFHLISGVYRGLYHAGE